MKNFSKISGLVLATSLALGSTAALADADYMTGGHPYVGVGLGYGGIVIPTASTFDNTTGSTGDETNSGGFAYAIKAGYLYGIQHFAVGGELSYNGFPNSTDNVSFLGTSVNVDTYKASSVNLLGVGEYFITPAVNVNVKAGGALTMQKYDINPALTDGTSLSASSTQVLPVVGAGVGYNVTQHVVVGVDGLYTFGDRNSVVNSANTNVDASSLTATVKQPLYSVLASVSYLF